ncbi:general secretion pathway protein GspK [Candidatus Sumerlaeota bacterium]|nr:general secretion pathway protein GspK [Candidatus Sumerlaeota bacterium]
MVLTLWIIVVLGMLSASMLEETHLEMRLSKFQRDDLEAMALARAGVARALADLRNDMEIDRTGQGELFDSLSDIWAYPDEGKVGRDNEGVEMGRGRYFVTVEDMSSRLDLNMISDLPHREVLRVLLEDLGVEGKEAPAIASAIIDWADADDKATPPGTGYENEYYSTRVAKESRTEWEKDQPPIYRCKNDRFSSVEELLSVYGVTPELFYGIDREKQTPQGPIEQFMERLKERRPADERKERIALRDVLTVHSYGSVNINTADSFILKVLFRAAIKDKKTADEAVQKIMALRKAAGSGRTGSLRAIRNISDLVTKGGIRENVLPPLMKIAAVNVRSDIYRIEALGEVGRNQHFIRVVVSRELEHFQPDNLAVLFEKGAINRRLADAFRQRHGTRRGPVENIAVRVIQWQEL